MIRYTLLRRNIEAPFTITAPDDAHERWDDDGEQLWLTFENQHGQKFLHIVQLAKLEAFSKITGVPEED